MILYFLFIIIVSLTIGLFIGLIIYEKSEKHKFIKSVFRTFFISFLFVSGVFLQENMNNTKWNNGECPDCHISWTFSNGQDRKNKSSILWYYCENCEKVIDITR